MLAIVSLRVTDAGIARMTNESETDYSGSIGNNSRPETIVVINCVLNGPLMLTTIIGNALVLAAISRTPSLRSPSITFLCSLAVSDLLVGFLVQPLYVAYELTKNGSLYKVMTTTAFAVCGVSLMTVTAISADRFLALHYHMRYPNLMTTRRVMYITGTIWIISALTSSLTFWNMDACYFSIAATIVFCLFVSSVCFIGIFRIVRQHQFQIYAQQQAVERINAENQQSMQHSKKSAINTFIYYIVMILCYTPLFIAMSMLGISPDYWSIEWNLTDTLAFMNSSINPFLYCWRLRELRTAVGKTVKHVSCKRTEEN